MVSVPVVVPFSVSLSVDLCFVSRVGFGFVSFPISFSAPFAVTVSFRVRFRFRFRVRFRFVCGFISFLFSLLFAVSFPASFLDSVSLFGFVSVYVFDSVFAFVVVFGRGLLGDLGCPGGVVGGPKGALGGSWGALGGSWVSPGWVLSVPGGRGGPGEGPVGVIEGSESPSNTRKDPLRAQGDQKGPREDLMRPWDPANWIF